MVSVFMQYSPLLVPYIEIDSVRTRECGDTVGEHSGFFHSIRRYISGIIQTVDSVHDGSQPNVPIFVFCDAADIIDRIFLFICSCHFAEFSILLIERPVAVAAEPKPSF